MSEHVTGN